MAGQGNGRRTSEYAASNSDTGPAPPSQEELRAVAEHVRGAFPKPFTATELVLIDVDPTTLHAFWTIPLPIARKAQRSLGNAQNTMPLVLRLNAHADDVQRVTATFDVEVVGLQSQTYVDIAYAERRFSAAIGVIGRGGEFQALATSNTARLPRLPHTASRPETLPAVADVPTAPEIGAPALGRAAEIGVPSPPPPPAYPPPPETAGRYDPLSETAAGLERGETDSAPSAIRQPPFGSSDNGTPSPLAVPFPPPPSEPAAYDPSPDGAGDPATQRAGDDNGAPSHDTLEPDYDDAEGLAAAVNGAGNQGASDYLPSSSAIFSAFGASDEAQPQIGDVRIEVELFGRARPGTHLFLLGRRVPLRPDGTFSCTHPLAGNDAIMAIFQNHGGAVPATSVMSTAPLPPANATNGEQKTDGAEQSVLTLADHESDSDSDSDDVGLEVNAVMHVTGRTDRNGDIHVLGRAITPDADGRFTVGHPLPHGALVLSALLIEPGNQEHEDAP